MERVHIKQCVYVIVETTGRRPVGWYT